MKINPCYLVLLVCFLPLEGCSAGENNKAEAPATASGEKSASDAVSLARRKFDKKQILTLNDIDNLADQELTIRPELAKQFCRHVYLLPSKDDFSEELGILCDDRKPNETLNLLDRYANISGDEPQSVELFHAEDDEYTEAIYATVYTLNIPPKWVRAGAIPYYMMKPSAYDYVTLDGKVDTDLSGETGGDLQFGKYKMNYKTDVDTPDGKPFKNERNTEFNAFQVHGGNPDIGIGMEHMTDTNNADFPYFRTVTVTIGNHDGGSVLITIVRGSVLHNGYKDLARKVFSDTATAQASNVRDGLTEELQDRVLSGEAAPERASDDSQSEDLEN